ncbi:MAG TPA: molybdopterin-dependent oxidoreductase, partial [Terriglobia bacterium]|nr:molybdopterin-dependent oxidoreductase [Terriglobia bacterium]
MERRKFIIGGIAGGISLAGYIYTSKYMNMLADPSRDLSVKQYEHYGPQAALAAITPNDEFYVTTKGGTPAVQSASWSLRIDGLVAHPLELNYNQLLALPSVEKEMTLECISNSIGSDAIGNAKWTGTMLKPLLERAQPAGTATHVAIYAADGFSTGHP